ncbi:MAG: hypothetical protein JO061_04285 [Acidobacteriaceae bacterium]|nr:hypothetical protein [Acidobacteriaceae bacterium]
MLALRWSLAALCLFVFAVLALANAYALGANLCRKHISAVPFVGGIAGMLGFLAIPIASFNHWWWLPPLADYGSLPVIIVFFVSRVRQSMKW